MHSYAYHMRCTAYTPEPLVHRNIAENLPLLPWNNYRAVSNSRTGEWGIKKMLEPWVRIRDSTV